MKDLQLGDILSINNKLAVVIEILNPNLSKNPRCWIKQDGVKYCVLCSDLKPCEEGD